MEKFFLILIGITIITLIINLPFGYLRSKVRKFSLWWFLYIHVPIPLIFILRKLVGLGYKAVPVIIVGAVVGQMIGGRINADRIS